MSIGVGATAETGLDRALTAGVLALIPAVGIPLLEARTRWWRLRRFLIRTATEASRSRGGPERPSADALAMFADGMGHSRRDDESSAQYARRVFDVANVWEEPPNSAPAAQPPP